VSRRTVSAFVAFLAFTARFPRWAWLLRFLLRFVFTRRAVVGVVCRTFFTRCTLAALAAVTAVAIA
jgi:hypothetical protein